METAIIAAIIASVTTLSGVFLGHWLAVSRRKERYADFLYQERFKAYMEYSSTMENLVQNYYETKWDEEGIKKLSRLWIRACDSIATKLLVFSPSMLMKVLDMMDNLNPKEIVKTENIDFIVPCLEICEVFLKDLEISHFDEEIKKAMEKFTRRNAPENMRALI